MTAVTSRRMPTLRQLEALAILGPFLFLGLVYFLVLGPVHPFFHKWYGFVVLTVALFLAVWTFSRLMFGSVRTLQHEVEALSAQTESYNRGLVALHDANITLARETSVDAALDQIVALSRDLLAARDASLALYQSDDPIGPRSVDNGDRQLTVEVGHRATPIGTLCVSRAPGTPAFSTVDREIARMFATHAGLVIQNDRLYDEVRALAIEGERQTLAREMHDSLAQVLSFVNTKAQAVEEYLRGDDVTAARQQMAELSAAAREVYADIREGIAALRVEAGGRGLREILEEYVQQFSDATRLEVSLEWPSDPRWQDLPPASEVQLLRIVQEALSNVRRHAHASKVALSADVTDTTLALTITDDGRGFESATGSADGWPRFGLQTMDERTRSIGGQFSVASAPDEGTTVTVTVPRSLFGVDVPSS